jgi:hypothetical protein
LRKKSRTTEKYHISGKIAGLKNEKVYLSTYNGKGFDVDSLISPDGTFTFQGEIKHPAIYNLYLVPKRECSNFCSKWKDYGCCPKDSIGKATVKGSKIHEDWMIHRKQMEGAHALWVRLIKCFGKLDKLKCLIVWQFVKKQVSCFVRVKVMQIAFVSNLFLLALPR